MSSRTADDHNHRNHDQPPPANTAPTPATPTAPRKRVKKSVDTPFKQQRLPSCEPLFKEVFPTFFVLGLIMTSLGAGYLIFSSNNKETKIDYTNCRSSSSQNSSVTCAAEIRGNVTRVCNCDVPFSLDSDYEGKISMYYELTNFYQNHRHYVKSRDDRQLLGGLKKPSGSCSPFDIDNGKWIWPCGAIANSMFQDEIQLINNTGAPIRMNSNNIAWSSDKKVKFRNPADWRQAVLNGTKFTMPKTWLGPNYDLENEDFIVWMRTAALSDFRKMHRTIEGGLRKGNYTLRVNYSFPVTEFHGTKSIILSTSSVFGAKNLFLGICSIVVGVVCLLLGILFFLVHIKEKSKF